MVLTESNYFSKEANEMYMGSSQYRAMTGTLGVAPCEARAMAEIKGEWVQENTTAFQVGNYVDAHFSGTLAVFKSQNPDMFKKDGTIKATFERADLMIARIERDPYFMRTLEGGMQEIFTAEFAGLKWKVKLDSYHKGKAIVDLKTTKSIKKKEWVKDLGHVNFAEYWGYYTQAAIYQKVVEISTGEKLPFFLAAVSKEPTPDIGVFLLEQNLIDQELQQVELQAPRVIDVKYNGAEPTRCEDCDYCTSTKKLTTYMMMSEL